MKTLTYREYLDRVWGCWLGKCIAGTIGAPYEGMKQLMNVPYTPSMIESMLPNDDLDLQVLWLDVLERKGEHVTSADLAEAFATRCPYAPGEYAIFKKNYRRGIHPPASGAFNNAYYLEGMGSPIRSEIWACIAPGNPSLAATYAEKDAILDHQGESVYGERFLAAVEAAAFFEHDLEHLYDIGLAQIPAKSRIARLIGDTRRWCAQESDWRIVRARIIREYGHADCTNLFQNIGITIVALHYGMGDLIETSMIGVNAGFDTDCTCATAGALLGIIEGADAMMKRYGFGDAVFVLGVDAKRRSNKVFDLAEDTCRMGVHFAKTVNTDIALTEAPKLPPLTIDAPPTHTISVDYHGFPAIGLGDTRRVTIHVTNRTGRNLTGRLMLRGPRDWRITPDAFEGLDADPGHDITCPIEILVPANTPMLAERNTLYAEFHQDQGATITHPFGMIGAAVWEAFGPFWENIVDVPPLKPGEHYGAHCQADTIDATHDRVRTYHLNTVANLHREYMSPDELLGPPIANDPRKEARRVNLYEDRFAVNDLVGFQGPCVVYAVRRFYCPEERTVTALIGHTDAFSVWLNGREIARRDTVDWWTAENVHVSGITLNQGENAIIARLTRRSARADFSIVFATNGPCSDHLDDFEWRNMAI